MTLTTKTGTVQLSALTLRAGSPQAVRMISDRACAKGELARCAPFGATDGARTLYWFAGARQDGSPVLFVQTARRCDWSPLVVDGIVSREETETLDLAQFENGSMVRVDFLAAASRHASGPWTRDFEPGSPSMGRHAAALGLDPAVVASLRRDGMRWSWALKDGTSGSRQAHKEVPLEGDDECREWLTARAFADGGVVPVEFQSYAVGAKRILRGLRFGQPDPMRIVAREYSALVVVRDQAAFADRVSRGVGRLKMFGLGLVRASLA